MANEKVKEVIKYILYLAIIVALAMFSVHFIGQRTKVVGQSMENTLHNGDNIIVEKISYRFSEPKRFDVIVFPCPGTEETNYIKRIIGLPGEKVQIKGNDIYINDKILDENFGKEQMNPDSEGTATEPVTLLKDEYFVLGDNRNLSTDSRSPEVGFIKRNKIIGKAWVRIYPFNAIGTIRH